VVWDLLKQVASNVTQSKNIINISLPVRLFEPRSYLERITDSWCLAPILLTRAAKEKDPLERLRLVIAFALGGLHNTCKQAKPFNPILGETFQGTFEDGTRIFCEQSSHHPPVTAWQVFGPGDCYHFYGYGEWAAHFSVNSVTGQQKGPHVIEFSDGGKITYTLPQVVLRGILWGDRIMDYAGTIYFRDAKNHLCAMIDIPPPASGGWVSNWWSGTTAPPTDYVKGEIYRFEMEGDDEVRTEIIAPVAGTWLGCIDIGGKPYWDHKQGMKLAKVIPVPNPLPSDSRFREDLVFLKAGDMEGAHKWKEQLENKQRRDARLRKEAHGGSH